MIDSNVLVVIIDCRLVVLDLSGLAVLYNTLPVAPRGGSQHAIKLINNSSPKKYFEANLKLLANYATHHPQPNLVLPRITLNQQGSRFVTEVLIDLIVEKIDTNDYNFIHFKKNRFIS